MAGKRKGTNGAGRFASSKGAKRKGIKSLPPRKRGTAKVTKDGSYPMGHGGNY